MEALGGAGPHQPPPPPWGLAGPELPPERRTPPVWGQRSSSDRVWRVSKVIGLCIPMLEWRRFGLYQHSIHSKMTLASSSRVCQVFESSNSSCIVPQNDSIMALS